MLDKYEYNNYLYINRKIKKYNVIVLIFLFIVLFLLLTFFLKYQVYYNTSGYIVSEEGKHYLKLNVLEEDISKIVNNTSMIIDDYEFDYDVYKISYELYIDPISFENYKEIYVDSDFDDREENSVIKIKIFTEEIKLIKYLIDFIFKEELYGIKKRRT